MSRLWRIWIVMALAFAGCATPLPHRDPIALDPDQTIIAFANNAPADEQNAALLLQKWLRRASGVSTGFYLQNINPSATSDELSGKTVIAVGETPLLPADPRLATLNEDGFLIHQTGSTIAIQGKTAAGSYYGAVAFLDKRSQPEAIRNAVREAAGS